MSRRLVASLSAALAVAVCGAAWFALRPADDGHLVLHEVRNVERVREERGAPLPDAHVLTRDPTERSHYLTEEQVIDLFDVDHERAKGNVYDPWCHFRRAGDVVIEVRWDEHPSGVVHVRTNAEGLADGEVDRETPRDLRVLALGDSHSFGVCEPEETWPNRLEAMLSASWPGRSFDVLNAAQGGHSFYQYLGMLQKYLDWSPDVVVVGVYAGNDFVELIGMAHALGLGPSIGLSKEEGELRMQVTRAQDNRYAVGQCYNAAFVFTTHPEHRERTVDRALRLLERMQNVCDAAGARLVVALIPAPCNMEWPQPIRSFRKVKRILELSDADCAVVDLMAQDFARGAAARGVPVVDATSPFRALPAPPYWRKDQHLNLVGHEELARALLPVVTEQAVAAGRLPAR